MKFSRWGAPGLLVAGALVSSSCTGSSTASEPADPSPPAQVDCTGKQGLRASGSTAQENAIEQFGYVYAGSCPGRTLTYNADGSTAGVEDFAANATDLAGSDTPLDPAKGQPGRVEARCGSPAWHLPTVFSPIAITYKISGVNSLNLDGPTAAKIFDGGITSWDHPAIKALNTGTTLPSTPIHVVFRSDRADITATFQRYLDTASDGAWNGGTSESFTGGVGEGAVSAMGTAALLESTDGSITYHEWPVAVGKQLPMARLVSSADPGPVSISADSVGRTIAATTFQGQDNNPDDLNDLVLDPSSVYQPAQAGAYPIVSTTYEIVCSKYPDEATAKAVKAFLRAAIDAGQDGLDQYGFVPLPESLRSKLLDSVNAIS